MLAAEQENYLYAENDYIEAVASLKSVIASSQYVNEINKYLNYATGEIKKQKESFFTNLWDFFDFVMEKGEEFDGDFYYGFDRTTLGMLWDRSTPFGNPEPRKDVVGVTSEEELEAALSKIEKSQNERNNILNTFLEKLRENGLPKDVEMVIYDKIKGSISRMMTHDEYEKNEIKKFAENVRNAWNNVKKSMTESISVNRVGNGNIDMIK